MQDIAKSTLYDELGFGGDPAPLNKALEDAGLSRAAKPRINLDKRQAVEALLPTLFMRVCARGDCNAKARPIAPPRTITLASRPEFCEICAGSVNRAAIDDMIRACLRQGWKRLCIVGGSPNTRREIESLVAGRLELRLVDGTRSQTLKQANHDVQWADRTVLWGGTQLDHKVSKLYRGPTVFTAPNRGLADLASAVVESARRAT